MPALVALTDLYTLRLRHGRTEGLRVAWVGDGNNVCHELMFGAARLGLALSVASPAGYEPKAPIVRLAVRDAQEAKSPVPVIGNDPRAAVQGAQAVFTDTWVSMGQEAQAATRRQALAASAVTAELMALAAPEAGFLQVRNRLPVTKAILAALLPG
jgi:ornithine carbamoyltransferase